MSYQDKRNLLSLTKQRGAAIIVALFVVALVAASATIMIERLRTDIRRTELIMNANTAYLYAQGSIAWAIDQLTNDFKLQQPNKVVDKTPIQSPVDNQHGAEISSIIYDAQGYFNINNLSDNQYQTNFTRLIQLVSPETDANTAQIITAGIIDWISPTARNPAFDEYYLKFNPSYRAPHRLMASPSELSLVKGVTPALFQKLSPYLIALPSATPINVNNAAQPVLMSLSMTMSADAAKALAARCKQNPFPSPQEFMNFDIVKNNPIDANKITTLSNYFLVETSVTLGKQKLILYTLLERTVKDKQATIAVLWQSKGTL